MSFTAFLSTPSIVRSTPIEVDSRYDQDRSRDFHSAFAKLLPLTQHLKITMEETIVEIDDSTLLPETITDLSSLEKMCANPLDETLELIKQGTQIKTIKETLDVADYIASHHRRGIDITLHWHYRTYTYRLEVDGLSLQRARDQIRSTRPSNLFIIHGETIVRVTPEGLVLSKSGKEYIVKDSHVLRNLEDHIGKPADLGLDANEQSLRIKRPVLQRITSP